jgi:hypothetical protein
MVTMEPTHRSDGQASPVTPDLPTLQDGDILSLEDGTIHIVRCQWQTSPNATLTFRGMNPSNQ